jgi:hypothetical protein
MALVFDVSITDLEDVSTLFVNGSRIQPRYLRTQSLKHQGYLDSSK